MATIDNIITRAEAIRDETTIGANTATRVGSVMVDTADHVKDLESEASTAGIAINVLEGVKQDPTIETGYIDLTGAITASSSYNHSDYIKVERGMQFTLKATASNSAWCCAGYDGTKTFVSGSLANQRGAGSETTYTYTIPEGVEYIRVCSSSTCELTCTGYTVKDAVSAKQEANNLAKNVRGATDSLTLAINGYVKSDGTMQGSSSYKRSDYIYVYEGQVIKFTGTAASTVCMVAAFADKLLSTFVSGSSVVGTGSSLAVEYVVPQGIKYVIIARNNTSNVGTIDVKYKALLDADKEINGYNEPIAFPTNGYIKVANDSTDGTLVSSTAYKVSDFIKVVEGQHLQFTTQGSASVYVLSAYSSADQTDYISGSALNIKGGSGNIDVDIIVPSGVAYIRICKASAYTANISLWHDGVVQDIENLASAVSPAILQPKMWHFTNTSPRKACVCFQLDWGTWAAETYKAYQKVLAQYGIDKSLYAVQPKLFVNDADILAAQDLYNDGQEIALHTDSGHDPIDNTSTLTTAQFNALMADYHKEMTDAGLDYTGCVVLSTNLKSDFRTEIVKHHIWQIAGAVDFSAIGASYQSALMALTDNYKFPKRLGIELAQADQTAENMATVANRAIELIDSAIANNGFLIIYGHSYMKTTSAPYTIMEDSLVPILQHLQPLLEKGEILTGRTSELIEYYFSKRVGE